MPAATGATELAILQEAQAMAQLSHPNVVAVYDVIVDARQVVLAMEYVPGRTLATWLNAVDGRRRPWKDVLRAFLQAGHGLAAAHRVGLVHRDFKPGNVLVSDEGRVLVADFGLAVQRRARDGGDSICGTPRYMAPEQRARYTIAYRLHAASTDAHHPDVLWVDGRRAWVRWQAGDADAAADLARVTEQLEQPGSAAAIGVKADIAGRAARALWEREPARARAMAARALADLQSQDPSMRHEARELEQWLADHP